MLSIAKLSPSGAQGRGVRYYLEKVTNDRDDYYAGSGEAPGYWVGSGCRALGLEGFVSAGDYLAVMDGKSPTDGSPLVPLTDDRLPGYDLTFSAPKSASLLWGFGNPEVAKAVRLAHDRAVAAALLIAESEACFVRRGHGGAVVREASGFVAAAFRHRTSRAADPHLHTHVVVANLAQGPEGHWSAPDGRPLYVWATALGSLYRSQLRAELAHLGLEWDHRPNGLAEVASLPRPVLRGFSRRRTEIEADQSRVGATSARAAEVAQRRTRRPKDPAVASASHDALRAGWAERLATIHVDGRTARVTDITGAVRIDRPHWAADRAELDALSADLVAVPPDEPEAPTRSLTAHASTFSRRDVVRSLANGATNGAQARDVLAAADGLLATKQVVPLLPFATDAAGAALTARDVIRTRDGRVLPAVPGDRRYSTPELLALEAELVATGLALKATGAGAVYARHLDAVLAGCDLSPDQAAVVGTLCRSGDGIELVVGPAGSGKTAALRVARQAWEADGYRVIGASLAARAAAELQAGSDIPSSTVHRLLADLEHPGADGLAERTVVVIDEASVVGSRMLARLLGHTRAAGAKLVLVGDPHQLPEVDAGGAFRGLQLRLGASQLTENHRQAGADQAWERGALVALRTGDVAAALGAYQEADRLTTAATAEDAYGAVIARWWDERQRSAESSVAMMAVTNAEVRELNARARSMRHAAGELGDEMTVAEAGICFAVGDRVVATDNDRRIDLLNGTFGTVTAVDPRAGKLTVLTDAGTAIEVPRYYLAAGHLTLGYATTIHKAHGATVDVGILLGSDALYREAGYVGMSRGRRSNHLYALGGDSPRWEIGHGRDGIIPTEPLDALATGLSLSKAQAMATEHQPDLAITGLDAARKAWETRHRLGVDLAATAPPDVSGKLSAIRRLLERELAAQAQATAEREGDAPQGATRRPTWMRRRAAGVEADVAPIDTDVSTLAASVEDLERELARLEAADAERQAWLADHAEEIEGYRSLGLRLAGWEAQLGLRASFTRPEYLTNTLGPPPPGLERGRLWQSAAGAIEGYRERWGFDAERDALGQEPGDESQRADYERAARAAEGYRHAERERSLAAGRDLVAERSVSIA